MFNKRTILRLNEIWSKDWFDEIKGLLTPFLQASVFNLKVRFVTVSALKGVNMKPKAIATASSHTNLGDDALLKKMVQGSDSTGIYPTDFYACSHCIATCDCIPGLTSNSSQ